MKRFWFICAIMLVSAPVGCEALQSVGDWIAQPDQTQVIEGAVADVAVGNWPGAVLKIAGLGVGALAIILGVKKVSKKKATA